MIEFKRHLGSLALTVALAGGVFAVNIAPRAAVAQADLGSVSGIISDTSGAVINNATVTVTNTATGAIRTVVTNGKQLYLNTTGDSSLSKAGTGDILSGIIGSLVAQKFPLEIAAQTGVYIHARAADLAAREGERGMVATDLLPYIRQLMNPV